jgi:hypothetical protein
MTRRDAELCGCWQERVNRLDKGAVTAPGTAFYQLQLSELVEGFYRNQWPMVATLVSRRTPRREQLMRPINEPQRTRKRRTYGRELRCGLL